MVTKPKLILADEPTGALDSTTCSEILDLISKINDEGTTVIIVTHEREIAARTKRILSLADGEIVRDIANAQQKCVNANELVFDQ